jgi:hypothetical protein
MSAGRADLQSIYIRRIEHGLNGFDGVVVVMFAE